MPLINILDTEPQFSFEPAERLREIARRRRERHPIRGQGDPELADALELIADVVEAMALAHARR